MSYAKIVIGLGAAAVVAGCATEQQQLAQGQGQATVVAERRGQFDLGCPAARGVILSSAMLQPVAWRGIERAEYTVGVAGCGKKATYVVICPEDSSGCVAGAARNDAPVQ